MALRAFYQAYFIAKRDAKSPLINLLTITIWALIINTVVCQKIRSHNQNDNLKLTIQREGFLKI